LKKKLNSDKNKMIFPVIPAELPVGHDQFKFTLEREIFAEFWSLCYFCFSTGYLW